MVFESFHHQAKISMSDRAPLAGFLMLWLKRCVVPMLPHEVIIANVVYPAVLLAHGKSIALLRAMVARIQSGLRALAKSFCQVEAIIDAKGHPVTDSNGRPLVKTPSPRGRAPIYVLNGLVCYGLSLTDDGGVYLRKFHAFRAPIGEFVLAAILYVLYPKDDPEREQLSVGQVLP